MLIWIYHNFSVTLRTIILSRETTLSLLQDVTLMFIDTGAQFCSNCCVCWVKSFKSTYCTVHIFFHRTKSCSQKSQLQLYPQLQICHFKCTEQVSTTEQDDARCCENLSSFRHLSYATIISITIIISISQCI